MDKSERENMERGIGKAGKRIEIRNEEERKIDEC